MSDSLAIAAVTNTLRQLIQNGVEAEVAGTTVTTRPLDTARTDIAGSQLNIFLYHALPNAAWRNQDIPWRTRPGETAPPSLVLRLYYLITAFYGQNEDGIDTTTDSSRILGTHRLLGTAMRVLHDRPVLDAETITGLLPPDDRLNHPYDQLENIRITPEPLSIDEVSKLWSGFQTQYRLSAAYDVSALIIESSRGTSRPLPVLRRGEADQGTSVLSARLPYINGVRPPRMKPGVEPGDILTVEGGRLDSPALTARIHHNLLSDPFVLDPLPGRTSGALGLQLPDETAEADFPGTWVAGVYSLTLRVNRLGLPAWTTNTVPFTLAPKVMSIHPTSASPGTVSLTVSTIPQVRPDQRVVLLFGDREIPPATLFTPGDLTSPTTMTFVFDVSLSDTPPDVYVVRLRVDGVDSIPVTFNDTGPPVFDASQKVTIS